MSLVGTILPIVAGVVVLIIIIVAVMKLAGPVFIGSAQVGIVERKWGGKQRQGGSIIALTGENGVQPDMLQTGLHFRPGLFFKVSKYDFVTVGTGSIAYIFARDGKPLAASQALAKTMPLEAYLDVSTFMEQGGQKGPQRTILREGTYIFHLGQFAIITESDVFYHPMGDDDQIEEMQARIADNRGFTPVIIDRNDDKCGIVVVNDGPSLPSNTIIAPLVGDDSNKPETYHNNFQNIEEFLAAGGYRGRQYQVITEGTWFINRLFATVELISKTVVPVGSCGVVVSYYGEAGSDVSGDDYRHGELVENGKRGIWQAALLPGKYAFNTYAGAITIVPTTNIILKWIKGETGGDHGYDTSLAEIGMITKDAFEPLLPLQVVIHIDYQMAPRVIQRFGDIKVLVNQSLDPMVSAFFKNIGQTRTLIELLQQRGEISAEALVKMKAEFATYDLALEGVLIGTPRAAEGDNRIDQILNQLRDRQVASEKETTYGAQQKAAAKERELNEATATAEQQKALTESSIAIQVQENQGKAEATRAQQEAAKVKTLAAANAEAVKLTAAADAEKIKLTAGAEAERIELTGKAEASRVTVMAAANAKQARDVGIAEAEAIQKRIEAFSGEGASLQVQQAVGLAIADAIRNSSTRLVPDQVITMGGGSEGQSSSAADVIMALLATQQMGHTSEAPVATQPKPESKTPVKTDTTPAPVTTDSTPVEPVAETEETDRKPRTRGSRGAAE